MKTFYILTFVHASAIIETVGGGASLARMAKAGFPVPGGLHISTEAYRTFVGKKDLQAKILAVLRTAVNRR